MTDTGSKRSGEFTKFRRASRIPHLKPDIKIIIDPVWYFREEKTSDKIGDRYFSKEEGPALKNCQVNKIIG
jgi:hypothetical protein